MARKDVSRWLTCKGLGFRGMHLTNDQVFEVRYLYSEGWTRYAIAKMLGCSWPTINLVVRHLGRFAGI